MGFQLDNISALTSTKKTPLDSTSIFKREIFLFGSGLGNKFKEDFYTEIGVLINAGISLKVALELIQNSQKKKKAGNCIAYIKESIIEGKSFSAALRMQGYFTDYEYYSVKIGEETGSFNKVCQQLGDFFAGKNEQRRTLIGAMTYPVIILTTALLVVVFMLHYVVPMFRDIFDQQKIQLPGITQFIIDCSEFVQTYGLIAMLFVFALVIFYRFFRKRKNLRKTKDYLLVRIPFLGSFLKTLYLAQFTQAVKLLTASKVPLVHSIKLVEKMIDFIPLKQCLTQVELDLMKGSQLSESMSKHSFFDAKMVALVKVAEETNQNHYIFERLNERYTTMLKSQSKLLSTVLEPFIILFVGIIVGIILIAMYLPMFKLSNVMG